MKCNCLNGRIGRPDLEEGSEVCWQCEGTGNRKTLYVEGAGACSEPEGKSSLSFDTKDPFRMAVREFMEKHKPQSITVMYEDGCETYTMEKTV